MWPTVHEVIGRIRGGTYAAQDFADWSMMRKGGASLAPYRTFEKRLPPEIVTMVAEKQKDILEGRFTVPINDKIPASD
jgi:basic membrane lipoprotein Med (substrate-binding protein (PBP1-ABC) superfamily)